MQLISKCKHCSEKPKYLKVGAILSSKWVTDIMSEYFMYEEEEAMVESTIQEA